MEKLGYTPATLVLDEKEDFNGYVPKNFSDNYKGWVTLREALAKSLNLPAVRVLDVLGVETGKLYASQVGIPFEKKDRGLTLALGGFTTGVSPLCLANSFTPFANGGYFSHPSCITKIENGQGEVIYERPNTKTSVLSGRTAYLITSMLESAATTGTARRVSVDGVPIAAKTGTAGAGEDNKDAWTVAYNPEYTMCCWMGFDSTDEKHCLPSDVTGGTFPSKLLQKILSAAYSDKKAPDFTKPDDIVAARIDIQSLENGSEPMLASAFTPDEQTMLEYFPEDSAPSQYTSYWAVPSPPDDLSVTTGDGGLPYVSFTPKESFIIYRIMRKDLSHGSVETIGEYAGATTMITINDFTAEYGHTYDYYVVPVHPEIEIEGERLCGPPSPNVRINVLPEENYMP
jgi:membrane peptidoglycan carboxypeptidase